MPLPRGPLLFRSMPCSSSPSAVFTVMSSEARGQASPTMPRGTPGAQCLPCDASGLEELTPRPGIERSFWRSMPGRVARRIRMGRGRGKEEIQLALRRKSHSRGGDGHLERGTDSPDMVGVAADLLSSNSEG